MREISLRAHVSRLLLAFGLVITLAVAGVSVFVNERLERSVWHAVLSSEANQMQLQGDFDAREVHGTGEFRVFSQSLASTGDSTAPVELRGLDPGYHDDAMFDDREHAVLVLDAGGKRRFLTYDTTINEDIEQSTWNAMLLFVLALAAAIWIAARIVAARAADSVLDLAAAVSRLPAQDRIPKLQKAYRVKEVSDIAAAIDGLLDRIQGFIERERAFVNALSHELTTPIAVISGAVDVLNSRENFPPECQPPLRRISATVRSMNDILKALLFLAREPRREAPDDERCRLDELLSELIESQPAIHGARHQALRVVASEPVVAAVAPGPATIVLGNLIRNALQHSLADTIEIRLEADRFILRDNGRGMTAEAISRAYSERIRDGRNDAPGGLGLSIVQRVCAHIGWRLCIDSALDGAGTSIVVDFGATVSAEPRAAR